MEVVLNGAKVDNKSNEMREKNPPLCDILQKNTENIKRIAKIVEKISSALYFCDIPQEPVNAPDCMRAEIRCQTEILAYTEVALEKILSLLES